MNIMRKQIVDLFNNPQKTIFIIGLWFSGYEYNGEYKLWDKKGKLTQHYLFKDGKVIKDYLE